MSLTAADLPRVRSLVSRLSLPAQTGSTNADLLAARAADPHAWPHLAVLATQDQTDGRGRRGRVWTAPAGAAIAVSVLIDRPALPMRARGWVSLAAGAAMATAVDAQLRDRSVRLKWPNDVLVDGAKICGVLAEVGADGAFVVGAGVNTELTAEQSPVSTATSFRMLGVGADLDRLLADYLSTLSAGIDALVLADGDATRANVREPIEALCGTLGSVVRVHLPDGEHLVGTASRLDDHGGLVVAGPEGDRTVTAGDVVHVR